jgi:hypothetical protein
VKLVYLCVLVIVLLTVGCIGCSSDNESFIQPPPPPPPSQSELEEKLLNPQWWFGDPQFVYAVQQYCVYIQECQTEHIWLGRGWGYSFPSYRTIVTSSAIHVGNTIVIHIIPDDGSVKCPKEWRFVQTYQRITGQFVGNAKGGVNFCIEDLRKKFP